MPHLFHPAHPVNRYYAWFYALHTRVDILLLAPCSEAEFETAEKAMHQELHAVEHIGNRFDPSSELSQAVQLATALPVTISQELYTLLERCLQANRDTCGLFDITVNSPNFHPGIINDVQLIPSAKGGSLILNPNNPSIILDLSGILKGYALERLRHLLPTFGIHDALINLGNSSILSLGNNPSDIPSGHCLTTSGNATHQRQHIRNPLTGKFITGQRQISVTTENAIDGEILSTTRFIQAAKESTLNEFGIRSATEKG